MQQVTFTSSLKKVHGFSIKHQIYDIQTNQRLLEFVDAIQQMTDIIRNMQQKQCNLVTIEAHLYLDYHKEKQGPILFLDQYFTDSTNILRTNKTGSVRKIEDGTTRLMNSYDG